MTTGFKSKDALIKWSGLIRFDKYTIEMMNNRYNKFFNNICLCNIKLD
jgi:hypothetical protein